MFRIDHASAVPALPAGSPPGTPGYFTQGDPTTGQMATVVTQDWANIVQEELVAIVESAGIPLDKSDNTQVLQAIRLLAISRWLTLPTGTVLVAGACIIPDNSNTVPSYLLPATPSDGDVVAFRQGATPFSSVGCTFLRNGNTIMGTADDVTISTDNVCGSFVWRSALQTWWVYETALAGANQ